MVNEEMGGRSPFPSNIVSQPSSSNKNTAKRSTPPSTIVSQPSSKLSRRNSPSPSGSGSAVITKRVDPRKSRFDPNNYRIITLSTGLTVFLISRENMAAANSPFGSSSDQGIALDPQIQGAKFGLLPSLTYLPTKESFRPCHHLSLMEKPICSFLDEVKVNGSHSVFPSFRPIGPGNEKVAGPPEPAHTPMFGPEESATSVAVVVNVGGFQDPQKYQGLAHFTEHMVHYGSKKFPKEDQFNLLVSNFGDYNAFTTQQVTSYYNQVPDSLLNQNLELYTEMLTNPLFREDTLKREVQAVDNEFSLKQRYWTRHVLLQHVALNNKKHPLAKFTCGNEKTLTSCKGQDGKEMREVMTSNHAKNYVASSMTACINSEKSLEEMEDLAVQYFANFKTGSGRLLHELEAKVPGGEKLTKADLKHLKEKYIYLQGDSRRAELALSWIIPATTWGESQETPGFVEALLRNSSENGLQYSLYEEGLIYEMATVVSKFQYATIVEIVMLITPRGRQFSEHIIQETFSYIKSLQGSSEAEFQRFFDEIKLYYQREFHYGSQYPTLETTKDVAMMLQHKDNLDRIILDSAWVDAKLNYKQVLNTLKQLSDPDHLIVIETIPKSEALCNLPCRGNVQEAPHSGACYMIVDKKLCHKSCSKCYNFGVPPCNPYLKTDYCKSQRRTGCGDADQLPNCPQLCRIEPQQLQWKSKINGYSGGSGAGADIQKITGIHFGHDPDNSDNKYKGLVIIYFSCPMSYEESDRNQALAYLWALAIRGKIMSKMEAMTMGSYNVNVVPGMAIIVKGFPTHMEEVVNSIITEMLDSEITELQFATAKEYIQVLWEEIMMSGENMNITENIIQSIIHPKYSSVDLVGQLSQIGLSDLKNAIRAFRMSTRCFVLFVGNVPVESFTAIARNLDNKDFGPHLDSFAGPLQYDHVMPSMYIPGEKFIRVKSTKSVGLTTAVTNVYSLGEFQPGTLESLLFTLSMAFIHCQAFSFLRTKEQLGYAVYARQHYNRNMRAPLMMFSVTIVATARKHTACELNDKIETFLDKFGNDLISMDDAIFNKMKEIRAFPPTVTKQLVGEWFKSKFDKNVPEYHKHLKYTLRGIKKVSVQVLTGNPRADTKACQCENCRRITGWEKGSAYESTLRFAVENGGVLGQNGNIFMKPANI